MRAARDFVQLSDIHDVVQYVNLNKVYRIDFQPKNWPGAGDTVLVFYTTPQELGQNVQEYSDVSREHLESELCCRVNWLRVYPPPKVYDTWTYLNKDMIEHVVLSDWKDDPETSMAKIRCTGGSTYETLVTRSASEYVLGIR